VNEKTAPTVHIAQAPRRKLAETVAQQILDARRQLVSDHAMAPGSGHHLHLQAALAARQIHLVNQLFGSNLSARRRKHHRERRRAAIVVFLREKRYFA